MRLALSHRSPLNLVVARIAPGIHSRIAAARLVIAMRDGSVVKEHFTRVTPRGIMQLSDAWIHASMHSKEDTNEEALNHSTDGRSHLGY